MIGSLLSAIGFGPKSAEAKCQSLAKQGEKLDADAADAGRKLDAAQAVVDEHAARLAKAEDVYVEDPSDKNAKAVGAAREALELARLRTRTPGAEKAAADRAVDEWREQNDAAQAELAAEQEAARQVELQKQEQARLVELRWQASVAGYCTATEPLFARLQAAIADAKAVARAIDEAFAEANAAAGALTDVGEPTAPLARYHLIGPLVLAHAERHPEDSQGLLGHYERLALDTAGGLAQSYAAVLARIESGGLGKTDPENVADALDRLEAVFASRNTAEAHELLAAMKEVEAVEPVPEPAETAPVAEAPKARSEPVPDVTHDTDHFDRLLAEQNARAAGEAAR